MAEIDDRVFLEEMELRRRQRHANSLVIAGIKAELFDKQLAFMEDPSRNKGLLCPRRSGKTQVWVRYAACVALDRPGGITRIWAINRLRAKQLIWNELLLLCARHQIKIEKNETELTVKFSNRSEIRLLGADKDKEAQKKRGDKTVLEIVLECQSVGSFLRTLVEEVAEPCLLDMKGTFCLEGTPGPVCTGYWFHVSGGENFKNRWVSDGGFDEKKLPVGGGWSMHRWSLFENPHLPHAREEVAILKAKRKWEDDNPTYIREWLGRWVNDLGALYYKFDPVRNVYEPPPQAWGHGWQHVLGWDLGARDDMALVVWGWHPKYPKLFEAFSWKKPGALAKEVMGQITDLETRGFNFVKKVADTGGGGKMYVDEVMSRYSQVFEAAEKSRKYDHVRLLNEDLLVGNVALLDGSEYAQEIVALCRDPDWPPIDDPDALPREDASCANHCCDAGLYAYRAAWHFLHAEEVRKPPRGSAAYLQAEEDAMENEPKDLKEWWDVTEFQDEA